MKKYIILILLSFASTLFSCINGPCQSVTFPNQRAITARPDFTNNPEILNVSQTGGKQLAPSDPTQNKKYSLAIQSEALKNSDMIPAEYTCNGKNISPDIQWQWSDSVPANVKSYAVLITSDEWLSVNAIIKTTTPIDQSHWVVFNIPSTVTSLNEGAVINGSNGTELRKYQGPGCNLNPLNSKTTTSTYAFTVYALDIVLDSNAIKTKNDLIAAIQGHIVASSSMTKRYVLEKK